MQGLGDLSGSSFYSTAWGVSADGTIVVGQGTGDSGTQAFVWDGTNGMDGLGDLPGGSFNSSAQAVSADGSIIVGWGRSEPGKEAFVWDSVNGMRGLGDLSGGVFDSVAYGVSRDGSRIVGTGKSDSGSEAFIWDEVNGMRSLKDVLTDLGLDLTGWSLWDAYRISDDGKTISGRGQNPDGNSEAWIAYLGSAPEISLSAAINNLNYETDPDADGYYDTFSFDISLDFNIVSGPANVFVQITSTATGQSWWSADPINLSSGSAANSATFNFDQTDFQDRFSGNIGLNFSVKIWDQSKKQIFLGTTEVTGGPVKAESQDRIAFFSPLGDLPGRSFFIAAYGISDDGNTVVGQSDSANGSEAFIWDSVSGIRGMSDLAGGDFNSLAYGVSGDGTIVVGKGLSASGSEAFVWDAADGIRGLGDLDGGLFNSRAYAITGDGSFIVGQGWSALTYDAFIWSSIDGMQGLRDPDIAIIPRDAWAISNDGSTVVGEGASAGNEAFIWDKQNGLRGLGDLPDGSFASAAQAVSTDGSVVAGYGSSASGTEAFIWDNDNGMQGLGDFPGGDFCSIAYGVSGDGAIVVGAGKTYSGLEAFIWDNTNGMRRLHEVLTGLGVDLTGWTLSSARAITPDGKSIAGYGNGPNGLEAWIAHLGSAVPPPTYTVTASAGSGGSISPSGEASVSEGDSIQYAIDPASGYHIDNVLVDGVSIGDVSEYIFIDVTANHAIEATFAINKYTITATAGAGGGISPSGTGSFVHGVSPTYTITPSEGYHIADVIVDDVSVGALAEYTFAPLTAPHSIEVVFAINTYIIMSSASQGGTISPSRDVSVEHGQSPSFTITPEQGYDISDLVVDGTSVGPQSSCVFQNVTEGHTIAAAFASNQFFVELTSPNGGERWKSGSVQTITWTSAQVEFVKIDYTANNGTNWYPIVDSTPASVGSYTWNMPLSFNGDHNIYKIRISDASDPAVNDWSDATFTIFKSIITWKGGAGPFWSTVSNWDPAVVPGPYDIVIISTGSIILSTHAAARLVNITGGNLNLNGNTLTVNGNFNLINGTLKMTAEGSVLDVNGDASFSAFDAGDNFTEGVIRVSGISASPSVQASDPPEPTR